MRARQPLDTVPFEHHVQRAARAAVGVGDEHALVARRRRARRRAASRRSGS